MSIKDNFPSVGPSLSLNFARSKTLDPRITFSRASSSGDATYTDANGLIVTAAADEPRFDHKIENGVVKSLGLLVEEQRTNVLLYSEEFDTGWTNTNASVTANATTAPDGTTTADKLVENSSTGNKEVNQGNITFTSGTSLTFSCFAKAAGRTRFRFAGTTARFDSGTNAYFDLSNGTVVSTTGGFTSASIEAYPNGWYRCVGTMLPTSSGTNNVYITLVNSGTTSNYTGDGSSGIYIWGAQLEAGQFPTSYIPTTSSTKTRVNDILSIEGTNFTDVYNQTEGSYKVEGFIDGTLPSNTYGGIFGAGGGGSGTSNFIYLNPGNNFGQYVSNTSQTPSSSLSKTYTNGAKFKIAASYLEADYACSFNGDISNSSTSGALNGSMTYFKIGANPISTAIKGAMRISNISYYPKQITDTQLQNLTK